MAPTESLNAFRVRIFFFFPSSSKLVFLRWFLNIRFSTLHRHRKIFIREWLTGFENRVEILLFHLFVFLSTDQIIYR